MSYAPTLESLRSHPVPEWYHDAKLGIFIHWSVSSVPAFAPREAGIEAIFAGESEQTDSPYSEWYWNSLKLEGSAVQRHHQERYGDQPYEAFADTYRKGLDQWQPAAWARAFKEAGARYVVLVTKHHDGFCLWPSAVPHPNPRYEGWNTGRDVVGELAAAVRGEGLRFGVYYSGGLDWTFDDRPVRGLVDVLAGMPGGAYPAYAAAQVRELIERYEPDVLWNDISWPQPNAQLYELVAHYYNAVPEGVINDRWLARSWLIPLIRLGPVNWLVEALLKRQLAKAGGMIAPPAPPVYDYRTPEYASFPEIQEKKWECVRGMDKSFGYNHTSLPEDFITREDLLHSFADIVSKNGNLLLNVGPRGVDAQIPEPQLERLHWLGEYLAANGEAIYGSRPWDRAEGTSEAGAPLRYTQRDGQVREIPLG
ncbi:MAG: alpha-L-fucosidase [Deltaproteobacteria bacterium]|jgi:alpha-L-fucosidase|nr:alpha-L-fucosidase [Deltaproteobacteria bacterium]